MLGNEIDVSPNLVFFWHIMRFALNFEMNCSLLARAPNGFFRAPQLSNSEAPKPLAIQLVLDACVLDEEVGGADASPS